MDPLGNPPLPWPVVVIGKLAMLVCIVFFGLRHLGVPMLYDSIATDVIGNLLAMIGLVLVILGFISLGKSLSVGLPREETELKTAGVYRITRNPLYFGGFLICAGSCLYALHPANVLCFAITVLIHHRIILREEEYLEKRFGARWQAYKNTTPRYAGIRRKVSPVGKTGPP